MGVHAQAEVSAVNTGARKHKDLSAVRTRNKERDISTYSAEIIEKPLEDLMISLENMFTVSSETTIKNAALRIISPIMLLIKAGWFTKYRLQVYMGDLFLINSALPCCIYFPPVCILTTSIYS